MVDPYVNYNVPWAFVFAQTILCILLVLYCIALSNSSSNKETKQYYQSSQSTETTINSIKTKENQSIIENETNQLAKLNSISSTLSKEQQSSNQNQSDNEFKKRSHKALPYRIQEEGTKKTSSEYTRRGMLWSRHASWHLPSAPRPEITSMDSQGLEHILSILKKYGIDPVRGFLPSQDPLQRLPYARYHLWEDLGDDLPKLLGARLGQARDPLRQLPVLMTDKLTTDDELRRAHLLLCLFAHAYIWGGPAPMDHIPEGIARPLWEVSQRLGIPPVLGHPSIVLYNWRRLDIEADIGMENLTTLNNFFDGRDESWFYLITVEVEARGAAAIVPVLLAMDAVNRYNEEKELLLITATATAQPLQQSQSSSLTQPLSLQQQQQQQLLQKTIERSQYDGIPLTMMRNRPLSRSSSSNTGSGVAAALARGSRLSGTSGSSGGGFLNRMNTLLQQHPDSTDDNNYNSNMNDNVVDGDKIRLSSSSSLYHENPIVLSKPSIDSEYRRCLWGSSNVNDENDDDIDDDDDDDESRLNRALIGALTAKRVILYVTHQLTKIAIAIKGMCLSIDSMREGCHPFIFYHRVRPFLSGWKDNPILPDGVIYEGVNNNERMKFYGGSAAQSALLPFLDITLGVSHAHTKSSEFLLAMRDYMNQGHRDFLVYAESISCIRQFVANHIQPITTEIQKEVVATEEEKNNNSNNNCSSGNNNSKNNGDNSNTTINSSNSNPINLSLLSKADDEPKLFSPIDRNANNHSTNTDTNIHSVHNINTSSSTSSLLNPPSYPMEAESPLEEYVWKELRGAYNDCISNLQRFRSAHINLVAEYIIAQQRQQQQSNIVPTTTTTTTNTTATTTLMKATTTTMNGAGNVEKDVHTPSSITTTTTTTTTINSTALSGSAGGKGTGGTDLMQFLKPIRDNVKNSMFKEEELKEQEEREDPSQKKQQLMNRNSSSSGGSSNSSSSIDSDNDREKRSPGSVEDENDVLKEATAVIMTDDGADLIRKRVDGVDDSSSLSSTAAAAVISMHQSPAKEAIAGTLSRSNSSGFNINNAVQTNESLTAPSETLPHLSQQHSTSLTRAGRSMSAQSHYRVIASRLPPLPPTPFEQSSPLPTTGTTQTSEGSETSGNIDAVAVNGLMSGAYRKDNAGIEDIDLYHRSGSSSSGHSNNNSYNPINANRSMSLPVTFTSSSSSSTNKSKHSNN